MGAAGERDAAGADAYRRLGGWLDEIRRGPADGWRLWVDPGPAPLPVLERWLLAHSQLTASSRIRTRSAVRLAQEWLAEAGRPVPALLDRAAWSAIGLALAKSDQPSPTATARLVAAAHEASLGIDVTPWLTELPEPWRTSAMALEAASRARLTAIRHGSDVARAGWEALSDLDGAGQDRLLLVGSGTPGQEALAEHARTAGLAVVSLPPQIASLGPGGEIAQGERLAARLAAADGAALAGAVELVEAEDPAEEAAWVAAEVRRAVTAGTSPEEIVVAVGQAASMPAFCRALRAAGLDPALSGREGSGWGGQRLVAGVAGLIRDPGRVEAWQLLADSTLGWAGLPAVTGSRLSRRLALRALAALPEGTLGRVLAWPKRAAVDQHLDRLLDLYEEISLAERVEALGESAVAAANRHLALLRQISETVGDCQVSRTGWADMLAESLASLRLPEPPPCRNQVRLTTLEGAVGRPSQMLWLAGLVAGTLPVAPPDDLPVPAGGLWQGWQEERLRHSSQLAAQVLASARGRVAASWSRRDETGKVEAPALWLESLRQLGAGRPPAHTGPLATVASWQGAGRRLALAEAVCRTTAQPLPPEWTGWAKRLASRGLSFARPAPETAQRLRPELARALFHDQAAVSDLEERARCPTRHLVRAYRWPEPKEGMEPRVWGEALHGLLGVAAARPDADWEQEVSRQLDRQGLPELNDPAERAFWQTRLLAAIRTLLPLLTKELQESAFQVAGSELPLGTGQVPALSLSLTDGTAFTVHGRIDRLDRLGDEVRLVDYKSGSLDAQRRDRWARLGAQLDLQLLAYALALRQGDLVPMALEYVGLATPWRTEGDPGEVRQSLDRVGLYAVRPGLADDLGVHEGKALVRADGSISRQGGALTPEQLDRLLELTQAGLTALAEAAHQGEVAPDPVRIGGVLACRECSLEPVCRYEGQGRRRVGQMKRPDFVAWLER